MRVDVYGANHSPWVQAVLLGLHEKSIEHSLRQVPPLQTLKKTAVLMPAVSFDAGPWQTESSQILAKLGFTPISEPDLAAVQAAWQGVLHRTDKPLDFFVGFANAGEDSAALLQRSIRNFLRSFIAVYMFTLITYAKRVLKLPEPADFGDQYLPWERALAASAGPFIDGDAPGIRDLLLFGVVQCHCSIPTPPLTALQSDPRLSAMRGWIATMHKRFSNYPHLYSGAYFAPNLPQPKRAGVGQRGLFYLGLLAMFVLLPVTLSLVIVLMIRVPR